MIDVNNNSNNNNDCSCSLCLQNRKMQRGGGALTRKAAQTMSKLAGDSPSKQQRRSSGGWRSRLLRRDVDEDYVPPQTSSQRRKRFKFPSPPPQFSSEEEENGGFTDDSDNDADFDDLFEVSTRSKTRVKSSSPSPLSRLRLFTKKPSPSKGVIIYVDESTDDEDEGSEKENSQRLCSYPTSAFGVIEKIVLEVDDVTTLQPEGHLNDHIIDFGISYFYDSEITAKDKPKIVLRNSFFFPHLIRKFTKSSAFAKDVDELFTKEFIFVPLVEKYHWVLACIFYPGLVWDPNVDNTASPPKTSLKYLRTFIQKRKRLGKKPSVVIFDSYREHDLDHDYVAGILRDLLQKEWKRRYGFPLDFDKDSIPLRSPEVPQQTNSSDCGIFTILFFESFFNSPIVDRLDDVEFTKNWFSEDEVYSKRSQLHDAIKKETIKYHPDRVNRIPAFDDYICEETETVPIDPPKSKVQNREKSPKSKVQNMEKSSKSKVQNMEKSPKSKVQNMEKSSKSKVQNIEESSKTKVQNMETYAPKTMQIEEEDEEDEELIDI